MHLLEPTPESPLQNFTMIYCEHLLKNQDYHEMVSSPRYDRTTPRSVTSQMIANVSHKLIITRQALVHTAST